MAEENIFEVYASSFDDIIELTICSDKARSYYFTVNLTCAEAKRLRKQLKEALIDDKP